MIGQANMPGREQEGKAVILCQTSKKAYYKKFLEDPLPVSNNPSHLRCTLICDETGSNLLISYRVETES